MFNILKTEFTFFMMFDYNERAVQESIKQAHGISTNLPLK